MPLNRLGIFHQIIIGNETFSSRKENLVAYPNPSREEINIDKEDFKNWQIIDLNGRILQEGNEGKINVERLEPGTYFLRIHTQEGPQILRFSKI